jgi:phosphoribosylanthranilate isomerase
MIQRVHVKVCGVTNVDDALMCVAEGVSAIGINLVAASPRAVSEETARAIAEAVRGRALSVGVVADRDVETMLALRERLGLGCLQLHGAETPDALAPLLPHAYKVLRVRGPDDVARADAYGGEHVLLDGPGSGTPFDWALAAPLTARRKVIIAGGLRPDNVGDAIRVVSPYCVDVASGVEVPGDPRRKDAARVRELVRRSSGDR